MVMSEWGMLGNVEDDIPQVSYRLTSRKLILICPLQSFRFTLSKMYSIHISMCVELETILTIQSIVVATGKLFVYGLMEDPK